MQGCYSNPTGVSIKELASLIGSSQTTLRNWESIYNIPVERNNAGQRIYSENIIKVFKLVKKYISEGLPQGDIKNLLAIDMKTCSSSAPEVEIIQDEDNNEANFSLIVRPYESQIKEYKEELKSLNERYVSVIAENATLTERVKSKDDIIELLQQQKKELDKDKETLNLALKSFEEVKNAKKWWKFWP